MKRYSVFVYIIRAILLCSWFYIYICFGGLKLVVSVL